MIRTVSLAVLIGVLSIITVSASADDDITAADLWYPGEIGSYWKYELPQSQETTATFTKNIDENGKSYNLIEETVGFFGVINPETEGYDPFLTFRQDGTNQILGYGEAANEFLGELLMEILVPGLADIGILEDIVDIQVLHDEWLLLETLNISHEWTVMRLEATSDWGVHGPFSIEARLHDTQSVQTRAGEFDAFPVEYCMEFSVFNEFGRRTSDETIPLFVAWLAPNVGLVQATVDNEIVGRLTEYHIEGAVTLAEPLPNQPPVASFSFSPENPTTNGEITFDASGSYDPDGQIVSYEWDFGDGLTASGQVVTHSYPTEGQYIVTLEVTDGVGAKTVVSEQVEVTSVAKLEALISTKLSQMPIYPLYLLDVDSFNSTVITKWQNFIDLFRQDDLTDNYDELYFTGIEYDSLRFMSLIRARDFLSRGDIANAKKYLEKADTYEEMSQISFQGATHVFEANSEAAKIIAQAIKDGCQASVKFGLKFASPSAAKGADFLYDVLDLGIEYYFGNKDEATKDFLMKRAMKLVFNEVHFEKLGGKTVSDWIKNRTGKYLFPALTEITKSEEWQHALSKVIKEGVESIAEETLIKVTDFVGDEAAKVINSLKAELGSPAEVRIYNSQGQVTGLVDGKVMNEIPGSVYDNESVIIFFPSDVYRYEVAGTEEGKYGLGVTSVEKGKTVTFVATNIPTAPQALHQYSVDWDALSRGEEGVTVQVDDDGDGISEHTIVSTNELTQDEYLALVGIIGDVNKDGMVDIVDIVLVGAHLGEIPPTDPRADVNGDGGVDILDLVMVAKHFGEGVPAAPAKTGGISHSQLSMLQEMREAISEISSPDPDHLLVLGLLDRLIASAVGKSMLFQNYPNPFNPETLIPYRLAEGSEVKVWIYGASGNLVRHLALGHKPAGFYLSKNKAAYWDGRDDSGEPVASGVYFYTFQAGDLTETRKMVIVR